MSDEELLMLLSIYLNPEFETVESVKENLESAGIDAEKFRRDILERIELLKEEEAGLETNVEG